ncbi:MAG: serine protease [Gordonia sp. (in: high G+C Gram-positive bacteria)]|uniref:serine protease n=1 Tax=Gordonia sp. (in: high G+C Gram-positive bacteria) TaxID=84139 RepID=UPI0039E2AC38
MKKTAVVFAAIIAAILGLTGIGTGAAQAAPTSAIGGGTPIMILKGGNSAAACTVTTVGRSNGRLLALTAGHCGTVGQRVLLEKNQRRGIIGTIARVDNNLDIAVISLDASKVRGTSTVGKVTIRRISTQPPSFPATVCKQGRTTGHTCGVVWGSDHRDHYSQMCVIEGDSGAPVVQGTTLVGMVNAYFFVSCAGPETGTNMASIVRRLGSWGYGGFRVV